MELAEIGGHTNDVFSNFSGVAYCEVKLSKVILVYGQTQGKYNLSASPAELWAADRKDRPATLNSVGSCSYNLKHCLIIVYLVLGLNVAAHRQV